MSKSKAMWIGLLSTLSLPTFSDVIINPDYSRLGVYPEEFTATEPGYSDLGDTNIVISRYDSYGFSRSGELTVNADMNDSQSVTHVNTDRDIAIGFAGNVNSAGRYAGGVGTLNVIGDGYYESASVSARNITVGSAGRGVLNIENGGSVSAEDYVSVSRSDNISGVGASPVSGSTGEVNVRGVDSELRANWIAIGDGRDGRGVINISQGADVIAEGHGVTYADGYYDNVLTGNVYVASGSSINLSGNGSHIRTNSLTIGSYNYRGGNNGLSATVTVTDNASILADDWSVHYGENADHAGRMDIGYATEGNMIVDHASVDMSGAWTDIRLGVAASDYDSSTGTTAYTTGDGSLTVQNRGRVIINGDTYVGGRDYEYFGYSVPGEPASSGELTVRDNGLVSADNFYIDENGVLSGDGGFLRGNVVVRGGTVAPGNSPGSMNIDGDLIVNSGSLEIELDSPTLFDQFFVSGDVLFGADAMIDLVLSYEPTETIDILDYFDGFTDFIVDAGFNPLTNINLIFNDATSFLFDVAFAGEVYTYTESGAYLRSSSVPEPSTFLLLVAGLAGLGFTKFRKRQA